MKKVLRGIALLLALSCLITGTAFSVNVSEEPGADESVDPFAYVYDESNYENEFRPGEVIVGLDSDVAINCEYDELFPELDIVEIREKVLGTKVTLVLELGQQTRQSVLDAIEVLRDEPVVEYAEPNYIVSAIETDNSNNININTMTSIGSVAETNDAIDLTGGVIPNDTYADYLWNMVYTEAFRAWNHTTGSDSVRVAVIDSGISPVTDLADNLDLESGINYIDPDELPTDDYGHGTHVAGIIGAKGNNNEAVAGVCWDVTLVPFKVLDSNGYGDIFDVAEAISAADEQDIPIINMSLLLRPQSVYLEAAIEFYEGLVVVSAGNSGIDLDQDTEYPATFAEDYDNVIVVGATAFYSYNELVWSGSNVGDNSVHLFAPGGFIYSTLPNGTVGELSGTSMAAPMVTGTAALILSMYPNCTAEQLKGFILGSVDEMDILTDNCITDGRLNVKNAVEYFIDVWGNGDVNMDGEVTNADVVALSRYVVEIVVLDADQLLRADVNEDGIINNADVIMLSNLIVEA